MLACLCVLLVAADPPADPWLGQLVMLRGDGLWIGLPDAAGTPQKLADLNANSVYRVLKTNGVWLWLRQGDKEGWLHSRDALLTKDAPAFFTERIREEPGIGKWYGRRATANQTLRRNGTGLSIGTTPQGADFASALADLSEAVRLEPGTATWWGNRAWVRLLLQQWDAARDDAAEAIQREPTQANWYFRRGKAWQGKKEYDIALKDCDEAIRLDPKEATYWNARGNLRSDGKGDHVGAVADYTEAIRLEPKGAVYHRNRGEVRTDLKQYDGALADLNRATELDPHWATPYRLRGVVYRQQKEWGQAVASFTQAIEREPKDVDNWSGRGAAHVGAKQYDKAASDYAECLRLDPVGKLGCGTYAWFRATCPEAKHRDGAKAVEYARKVAALGSLLLSLSATRISGLGERG